MAVHYEKISFVVNDVDRKKTILDTQKFLKI